MGLHGPHRQTPLRLPRGRDAPFRLPHGPGPNPSPRRGPSPSLHGTPLGYQPAEAAHALRRLQAAASDAGPRWASVGPSLRF